MMINICRLIYFLEDHSALTFALKENHIHTSRTLFNILKFISTLYSYFYHSTSMIIHSKFLADLPNCNLFPGNLFAALIA